MMDELETAWKEAHSLVPGTDSPNLIFIGIREKNGITYKFFRNKITNEYFYTSSATENFDKEMKDKQKERKMKRYSWRKLPE